MSNSDLGEDERASLLPDLMAVRRDVGAGLKAQDRDAVRDVRRRVDAAKRDLGERGPVWWTDGAPDLNQQLARNTSYASWSDGLKQGDTG